VFAVHPLQVEAVAWTSGLKDVLAGLLGFAALYSHLRLSDDTAATDEQSRFRFTRLIPPLLLVLAMLSKPSAMVIPAIVIVIDWLIRGWRLRAAVAGAVSMFVVALPLMFVARRVQDVADVPSIEFWKRFFVAGDSTAFYLWKLVWPVNLGVDYGRTPSAVWESPTILVAWLLPVTVIAVAHFVLRSRSLVTGLLVFAIAVAPTSGLAVTLFQLFSTVADHYTYIAMLGVSIGVSAAIAGTRSRWVALAVALLLPVLAARSFDQSRYWQSSVTLFTRATEVNPESFLAWNNLGDALARRGELRLSQRAFERALAANPRWYVTLDNLAFVQHQLGDTDAAIDTQSRAVEVRRSLSQSNQSKLLPDALQRLGALLLDANRAHDAIEPLREALRLRPQDTVTRELLAAAESRAATRPGE
jgi:Flp pilus assembly protein TadD